MSDYMKSLYENAAYIKSKISIIPKVALVLGSGLGSLADEFPLAERVPYSELKDFPVSTVSGHSGQFVFVEFNGVPAVLMQGRVHYYEGYAMTDVVKPIRLMKLLGVETVILTNAAGGLNENWDLGTLMMITGHISSFVPSPLIGENHDELGIRFPDMSNIYNKELQMMIEKSADEENIALSKGVYLQTTGPNYETPEEVRMFKLLGADAVGMSTACEAMAAKHCGMSVCGISCITNKASGISESPLSHEEVKVVANKVSDNFKRLIKRIFYNLKENFYDV